MLVGVVAAAVAVVGSARVARAGHDGPVDRAVRAWVVRTRARGGPRLDRVVVVTTELGSVYGLTGVALALALLGRRGGALSVLVAGVLAWAIAQGTKPLLGRARPYQLDGRDRADRLVAPPAGSSWPSGHAAVAMAVAVTLSGPLGGTGALGGPGTALVVASAAWVAVTRCYVGVHHASDVVGGAGLGALAAWLAGAVLARG